jgi:phospholipase C
MRYVGLFLVLFLLSAVCEVLLENIVIQKSPIKHVVVLMLENRSFDHLLGHLKKVNPNIDGLFGNETNPINVNDPKSRKVAVTFGIFENYFNVK